MTDRQPSRNRWGVWPQWPVLTAATWSIVAIGLLAFELRGPIGATRLFVVAVGVTLAVESVLLWRSAREVAPPTADGPREITLATWVTVVRAASVALLAGFALTTPTGLAAWLPGVLFLIAAGFDAIDGAIARLTDSVTDLGAKLDVEIDALAVLVGTVVAIADGAVPTAFLLVGVARYLFVAGNWWRRRRGFPVRTLHSNPVRRPLGALAMLAIWLALLPVPDAALSRPIATVVMVPFLLNFCWDWLAVTNRVGTE